MPHIKITPEEFALVFEEMHKVDKKAANVYERVQQLTLICEEVSKAISDNPLYLQFIEQVMMAGAVLPDPEAVIRGIYINGLVDGWKIRDNQKSSEELERMFR